jgi:hypothetical protein
LSFDENTLNVHEYALKEKEKKRKERDKVEQRLGVQNPYYKISLKKNLQVQIR